MRWLFPGFVRDSRGVSAVEFAILAPLMIALYLGCVEISDGVAADRKVTLTAGALANLAAAWGSSPGENSNVISNTDMTNILNASASIIKPYSASSLVVTLSCLKIDAEAKATVSWSESLGGTPRGSGSAVSIPTSLAVPNSTLIFSEVTYSYTPIIGHTITGTLTLSDHMYMSPRIKAPKYGSQDCSA
ncbi:MAG TPA: TadE/TadG family type IV pilus assembly protein [Pseudolabrys sp.]|nr:TadE/TadG family type IV pilus assembly protein [Pseudolabrys sp.]